MIALLLAGLAFYALVGFEFGFDGVFLFLGGLLAVLWAFALFSTWHGRRHRYDGIEANGHTRVGLDRRHPR